MGMQDLYRVHTWSWGGMALAYLYTQLSEAMDPTVGSIVSYMYLLKVVTFFFSIAYYKCVDLIVLCMHVMLKYLFVYTCVDMIVCLCL